MIFTVTIILYYILISVTLFGVYIIYKQLSLNKTTKMFIGLGVLYSFCMIFSSFELFGRHDQIGGDSSPLNYAIILNGVFSQLFMLFFFYSQIFSIKTCFKIIGLHTIPVALICIAIAILSNSATIPQFQTYASMSELMNDIDSPIIILRFLLIFLQLLFVVCMVYVFHKLVPLYQRYIEANTANAQSNIFWINEFNKIYLILTVVYISDAVFQNYITSIAYLAMMIIPIARLIVGVLQYKPIEVAEDLYDELNIKWSFKRAWYIEETNLDADSNKSQSLDVFNTVDAWIQSQRAYLNPSFSFKNVTDKFPNVDYKSFDIAVRETRGHSFQAYIREYRINEAMKLISTKDSKIFIKDVAFEVGFESADAFSRAFKEVTGQSATQWRNSAKKLS